MLTLSGICKQINIQIYMKRITLFFLVISILTLSSCVKYTEIEIPQKKENENIPEKVLLFIDCSASMKGFFNNGKAATILSNIEKDFKKEGITVEIYKFNKNIDSVATFNSMLNEKTFNCGQNLFSAPFAALTEKITDNQIAIIITDAVISTSGTNYDMQQEYDNIQKAIVEDQNNNNNNFGIFHYLFDYNGTYYAQPSDSPIVVREVTRNFYLFTLANPKFNSLLNQIIVKKNPPNNYQYFTQAYNDFIEIKIIKEPTLVVSNQFSILMTIDKKATSLTFEKLQNNIEILSQKGVLLEKAIIKIVKTAKDNEFIINIDLDKIDFTKHNLKIGDEYKLRLKEKTKIKPEILALNYDILEEPTKTGEIDHSKTYRLIIILDALQYRYQDSYTYETIFKIVKSEKKSMFAWFYVPIWGQSKDINWVDKIYSQIFWIWIIIPFIFVLFFYFGKRFDNNTFRAKKIWFIFGGIVSPLTTFFITLFISIISTNEIAGVITHSIQNMIVAIIPFIIFSIIFKRFNQNLINIPF